MNPEKVTVIAYIEVKPGTEETFLKEISPLVEATRTEASCINYDFHRSTENPNLFMFYENWTSMEGLNQHARSAHIQTFRANIADLLAKPVEIKTYEMITAPAG